MVLMYRPRQAYYGLFVKLGVLPPWSLGAVAISEFFFVLRSDVLLATAGVSKLLLTSFDRVVIRTITSNCRETRAQRTAVKR